MNSARLQEIIAFEMPSCGPVEGYGIGRGIGQGAT
jgi:hypothetical protein